MQGFGYGELKIKWAYDHMPLLKKHEKVRENKPFKDKIALSVHLEAKRLRFVPCTCVIAVPKCTSRGSKPSLSTQDDGGPLVKGGMNVFCTPRCNR